MLELDIAVLIIFALGTIGRFAEPWSPHPSAMVWFGTGYFCVRIAMHILVWLIDNKKEV